MDANTRDVLTIEEVGQRLNISRWHAYQMLREGVIPCIRLGRRIIIPKAAFEAWLLNCARKE